MLLSSDSRPKRMKIFILGAPSSGKTSIFNRIANRTFLPSEQEEVGFDIGYRSINIQSRQIKLQLWNTNGQGRYFQLIKNFIASSKPHGIIIAYDITDMQSYKHVEAWINITYEVLSSNQVAIMLVGNCLDLQSQRVVSKFQPIKDYKFRYELDFMEISAKTGQNCEQMVSSLVERILGRLEEKQQETIRRINHIQSSKTKSLRYIVGVGRPKSQRVPSQEKIDLDRNANPTCFSSHIQCQNRVMAVIQQQSSLGCS